MVLRRLIPSPSVHFYKLLQNFVTLDFENIEGFSSIASGYSVLLKCDKVRKDKMENKEGRNHNIQYLSNEQIKPRDSNELHPPFFTTSSISLTERGVSFHFYWEQKTIMIWKVPVLHIYWFSGSSGLWRWWQTKDTNIMNLKVNSNDPIWKIKWKKTREKSGWSVNYGASV